MLECHDCSVQKLEAREVEVAVSAKVALCPSGLQMCRRGSMTLVGVAAGSWTVNKASLGGGEAGFLMEAPLPFKMAGVPCLCPTAQGGLKAVSGALHPGEPGLPAPPIIFKRIILNSLSDNL